MEKIKVIILFNISNLFASVIINNLYDWQGRYFMLGLMSYLYPNIIGLGLNLILLYIFKSANHLLLVFILPIAFFISNEFSYLISENHIIFFSLFQNKVPANQVQVNRIYDIITSTSALISSVIVGFRLYRNREW